MTTSQKSLLVSHISLFVLSGTALFVSACSHPAIQQSASTEPVPSLDGGQSGDRRILAGDWEYDEAGGMVVLTLDEEGNGPYAWKDGRIETQTLVGQIWQGMWSQQENDREGGFMVEFSPDFSEGNGTWWYTRIGSDRAPDQQGGTFHLIKRPLSAKVNATLSAP